MSPSLQYRIGYFAYADGLELELGCNYRRDAEEDVVKLVYVDG